MEISARKLGRLAVVAGTSIWTLAMIVAPMDDGGSPWLHPINLVFHEAGHIIFAPFGAFMTTLGGSLMQLLVPFICALTLYIQNEDPFGAALCAWWAGENLLDLAPYINDARALNLMLLGGPANAVEGHDWEAILTTLGWLHLDHTLANGAHLIGAVTMCAALAWAFSSQIAD
jgi:hypothetical protein